MLMKSLLAQPVRVLRVVCFVIIFYINVIVLQAFQMPRVVKSHCIEIWGIFTTRHLFQMCQVRCQVCQVRGQVSSGEMMCRQLTRPVRCPTDPTHTIQLDPFDVT